MRGGAWLILIFQISNQIPVSGFVVFFFFLNNQANTAKMLSPNELIDFFYKIKEI